jgi:protein-serine/threonine kinase
MNPNSSQQPNRLQLNFGFNNDRNNAAGGADNGRQYPTTPSTFPQPVFPNQNGQQEVWGTQPTNTGYGNAAYFVNNPYQSQYQPQTANLPPAPATAYRSPGGYNDGTNGLVHQFSHQNLGGNTPRAGSPYTRQQSPGNQQRPRTAGSTGQQQQQQQQHYGNFLTPQMPSIPAQSMNEEEPPAKNPDKYADNVLKKAKVSTGLVSTFFKDNVQRARDRNGR